MNGRLRVLGLGTVCLILAGLAAAVQARAITNWRAPATWTPTRGMVASALADLSDPLPFVPVEPCRVADTRGNGFGGEWGPPIMSADQFRDFTIGGQCGIPTSAMAVSFNFTVTAGTTLGFLRVLPAGGSIPVVSTLNWSAFETKSNASIVPLGTGSKITVNTAASPAHVIIDINGYYAGTINSFESFRINGNYDAGLIHAENDSTAGGNTSGLRGVVPSGGAGASGVLGEYGGTAAGYGVEGTSGEVDDAAGVVGRDQASTPPPFGSHSYISAGVRGESAYNVGVLGLSTFVAGWFQNYDTSDVLMSLGQLGTSGFGVGGWAASSSPDTAGVLGYSMATSGRTYGVLGLSDNVDGDSAAVKGTAGDPNLGSNGFVYAGVRGEGGSTSWGVLAISHNIGLGAYHLNASTGAIEARTWLASTATRAIHGMGDMLVTGTKSFVDPHPTDPTKEIKYVSLEGPESGTYFRGRGRFEGHAATIEVPEDFRLVTDPDGLTVQVTPVGELATVAVVSIGLGRIELKSSRDVEFFYFVQGVRRAFKDFQPIQDNEDYKPMTPKDTMSGAYSAEQKRILIRTGIYNEDGTVNMETAERLGWAQQWRDRDAQMKAAAEEAAAKRAAEQAKGRSIQRR